MKKFTLFIFLFVANLSIAQMTEGMIQYNIDVTAVDTSLQTRQTVGLLRNSMMKIYFTQEQLRIDYKLGDINDMKMIVDYNRNASLSLFKNPKGKYAVLKKANELEYNNMDPNSSVKLYDETKMVMGFKCKKAVVTSNGMKIIYWYTNEISANLKKQKFYDEKIPGFPMIFSTVKDGIKMSYQVSNIEYELSKKTDIFSMIPPSGYQVINQ